LEALAIVRAFLFMSNSPGGLQACEQGPLVQQKFKEGGGTCVPRSDIASRLGSYIPTSVIEADVSLTGNGEHQPLGPVIKVRLAPQRDPSYKYAAVGFVAMVQERQVRVERRLAAILAADVAGYSRLMHNDEEATHAKLNEFLTEAVNPAIAEHGGRIVKNTGDGFLAEVSSAVKAVRAAVQFQTRVKELTSAEAEDRRIAFRVGINVGDVIVEPHDIFGDGVNIAARLESISEPGGICISLSAYDHVRGKVGVEFADQGEQNLKNIERPVRAYAVVRDGFRSATQIGHSREGPLSPPRLSIVVLPFATSAAIPNKTISSMA
jgi:class 3 adenylate cyclase